MLDPKDIYRAAQIFLDRYGDEAEKRAWEKYRSFIEAEDAAGAYAWLAIARAIPELSQTKPKGAIH